MMLLVILAEAFLAFGFLCELSALRVFCVMVLSLVPRTPNTQTIKRSKDEKGEHP